MTAIRLRPEAEADLQAIALHVAEHSVERARALVARLRGRCGILASHPFAGRPREELGEGVRALLERPYVILYVIDGETIEIVAFVHGARDLPSALAARMRDES